MNADEKANLADALLRLEMASRMKLRQLNCLVERQATTGEVQQLQPEDGAEPREQQVMHQGSRSAGPR